MNPFSNNTPAINPEQVYLSIGGIGLELQSHSTNLLRAIASHYAAFVGVGDLPGKIQVTIYWKKENRSTQPFLPAVEFLGQNILFTASGCRGTYAISQGMAELFLDVQDPFERLEYFLRLIVGFAAFDKGGFLFHGAGIAHKDHGIVFFGPSGAGKTTVSRFSVHDKVLNDDLILMFPSQTGWTIHSTPFWNPTQVKPYPTSVTLSGMFRLIQARSVFCEKPGKATSLAEITSNIPVLCTDPQRGEELMHRVAKILDVIPVYRLHFLKDDTFWKVVDATLQIG